MFIVKNVTQLYSLPLLIQISLFKKHLKYKVWNGSSRKHRDIAITHTVKHKVQMLLMNYVYQNTHKKKP